LRATSVHSKSCKTVTDYKERDWRNAIPRSTLLMLKLQSAMADLSVVHDFIENNGYADRDVDMLFTQVENLCASLSELRCGVEISADATCISDEDFHKLVEEDDD
jgi:hypothetical protein